MPLLRGAQADEAPAHSELEARATQRVALFVPKTTLTIESRPSCSYPI
jgi:hypothetical protein